MVEVIGDVVMPAELVIPRLGELGTTTPTISGAIWLSGGKLHFFSGSNIETITSA